MHARSSFYYNLFSFFCSPNVDVISEASVGQLSKGLFTREAGRDVCRDGTGRYMGSRHICIALIFITFRLYGKNVCRDVFRPVPEKRDPGLLNFEK